VVNISHVTNMVLGMSPLDVWKYTINKQLVMCYIRAIMS